MRHPSDGRQRGDSGAGDGAAAGTGGDPAHCHRLSPGAVRRAAGGNGLQSGGLHAAGPGGWADAPDRHGGGLSDQHRPGLLVRHGIPLGRPGRGGGNHHRSVPGGGMLHPASVPCGGPPSEEGGLGL